MLHTSLYILTFAVFRKSDEKPNSRQMLLKTYISLLGITTGNNAHDNAYQGTPVPDLPNKGNESGKISDTRDSQQEYALPKMDKKNASEPQSASATKENITEYNPPKKDRQAMMQGANGNEEAGWMENNNIYDGIEEYEGSRRNVGRKVNSIHCTIEF